MKWLLFVHVLFIVACSQIPANIKNPPAADIHLQQVLENHNDHQNKPVRWGGTVIDVENNADSTSIQIQYYPLDYYGRPKINKKAHGRFITISQLFLDPDIYKKGTPITVVGTLQGKKQTLIGNKSVTLPVIVMDSHHKWPKLRRNYFESNYSSRYFSPYYGYRYPYSSYRRRYRYNRCY